MLQLTLPSNIKLASGRTIADIETLVIPSVDSKYIIIKTRSGWQVQYMNERGQRMCIAVDCVDKQTALAACKKDHVERLEREIRRLKGEL